MSVEDADQVGRLVADAHAQAQHFYSTLSGLTCPGWSGDGGECYKNALEELRQYAQLLMDALDDASSIVPELSRQEFEAHLPRLY